MEKSIEKKKYNTKESVAAYLFLLPSLVGFVAFVLLPIVGSLFLSFTNWNFLQGFKGIEFNGIENFRFLLSGQDIWFRKSMINSILFTALTVPVGIGLGMVLAFLINKYAYASTFLKVAIFIPYISSIVASAVVWQAFFHPTNGPVTNLLLSMGVQNPPTWFVDMKWALPLVIVFQIWQSMGYNVIVFSAGLKGISESLYEAATLDGANDVKQFLHITIPMISPTTFFLSTMGIISSFKVFDAINVLTKGGPGTQTTMISYYIYREAFQFYRMGTANSAAWLMFIIIFIITIVQQRYQNKWVIYE